MKTVTLYEHEKLYATDSASSSHKPGIRRETFERLRDFDLDRAEREAGSDGDTNSHTIFDWSRRDYAKARQYVGVLSLGNITVEILPKTEKSRAKNTTSGARTNSTNDGVETKPTDEEKAAEEDGNSRVQLLHMLRYAGVLKAKSRDIAMLASSRASMSELLFWLFAQRVREELGRGMVRQYEERREELGVIRGRIDVKRYAQTSIRRPGKMPCVYERHSVNTPLLRLLRAACELLIRTSTATRTKEVLREVLVSLDGVDRVALSPMLADAVQMTRRNDRFEDIVVFCRMLAHGQRPDSRAGDRATFSLLFDMNRLFEGFLGGFFREEVLRRPKFKQLEFREQGTGSSKHLLKRTGGNKTMRLKPDLVFVDKEAVDKEGREPDERTLSLVMDAKWKRPSNRYGRPSGDVLYQMYAYATQFDAPTVVVLYPERRGTKRTNFQFAEPGAGPHDFEHGARLLVRYVPLDYSLNEREEREALAERLADILNDALNSSASCGWNDHWIHER